MRNKQRLKEYGEYFTPQALANKIVNSVPDEKYTDHDATLLDPQCGNGAFIVAMADRMDALGVDKSVQYNKLYGCDIMLNNVAETLVRLVNSDMRHDYVADAMRYELLKVQYRTTDGVWHPYTFEQENEQVEATAFRYKGVETEHFVCCDALQYHFEFDGTLPQRKDTMVKTVKPTKTKEPKKLSHTHRKTKSKAHNNIFNDLFN